MFYYDLISKQVNFTGDCLISTINEFILEKTPHGNNR